MNESITCPKCGATSYNPNDVANRYCGRCHVFLDDAAPCPLVKQAEELLAEGGKFYRMGQESWCDTPLDSWKLIPERGGYIRQD